MRVRGPSNEPVRGVVGASARDELWLENSGGPAAGVTAGATSAADAGTQLPQGDGPPATLRAPGAVAAFSPPPASDEVLMLGPPLTETTIDETRVDNTALEPNSGSASSTGRGHVHKPAWLAAGPVDGCLAVADAVDIFERSGLPKQKLSAIWNQAKDLDRPKHSMNEAEFAAASELIAAAGGRLLFEPLSI